MRTAPPLRSVARGALRASWLIADACERRARIPLPPRRLVYEAAAGDYDAVGRAFFPTLVEHGLNAHDQVLEVGSGIGRLARFVGPHLADPGRYVGVDCWAAGVDWCTRALASRLPTCSFVHLTDLDARFQPEGEDPPGPLPLPDGTFDFAYAVAILHSDAARIAHYTREIGRVLRVGGRYLGTWYLFDDGPSEFDDGPPEQERPPQAFPVGAAIELLEGAGIEVESIERGSWSGRVGAPLAQDLVVGRRVRRS